MDTFTAIPSFIRMPITVLDMEKYGEWLQSDITEDDKPPMMTRIFIVWTKGPGTPVPVQIEVDQIETEYTQNQPTEADSENMSVLEYYDKWRRVNMLLRRNLLSTVVEGLGMDNANYLAADDEGDGRKILEKAGWVQKREEVTEVTEDSENEKEGEGEIGESTSSMSPQSIQE